MALTHSIVGVMAAGAIVATASPSTAQESVNALVAFVDQGGQLTVSETSGPRTAVVYEGAVDDWEFAPDATAMAVGVGSSGGQQGALSVLRPGRDPLVLTSIPAGDRIEEVDWSPSGGELAYQQIDGSTGESVLRVVDAAGGQPRQIASVENAILIGWQPEAGSRHLAVSSGTQPDVELVDVDTGLRTTLSVQGTTGGWSPLGSHLAVAGTVDFAWMPLTVVDVRSGETRQLLDTAATPAFSPDGRQVAVWQRNAGGLGGRADLVVVDLDSGASMVLVSDVPTHRLADIEWTPDGGDIAYTTYADGGGTTISLISTSGGEPDPLFKASSLRFDLASAYREAWVEGMSVKSRDIAHACPREVPDDGYSDVPASNAHEFAIDCVSWWNVARGTSTTTYSPQVTVNRAQMASFLARLISESGGELPTPTRDWFADDNGNAHESAINRLAEAGIVSGGSDGRYHPSRTVNRAQMARFLVNTTNWRSDPDLTASNDYFTDDTGNAHEPAINAAAEVGITGGTGEGVYNPAGPVRRDQMASFLARVLDLLVERGDASLPN